MHYATDEDVELRRAMLLVHKDHKQRWVYYCRTMRCHRISEMPLPYVDKISVYWMPGVQAVGYNFVPRLLAHSAV